jgi:hypothetical protein
MLSCTLLWKSWYNSKDKRNDAYLHASLSYGRSKWRRWKMQLATCNHCSLKYGVIMNSMQNFHNLIKKEHDLMWDVIFQVM